MNPDILDRITGLDYAAKAHTIGESLAGALAGGGPDGAVFGLSGGIDSSVVAALCARTIKDRTLALIMPDSGISPDDETGDALGLADSLGLEYKLIDIKPIVNEYAKYLEPDMRARGNLRARIRANILYYYANLGNRLVLGSSDRSEWLVGYFTKFGDGAYDMAPIISLYKLQVRGLARYLRVPEGIISKKSSPHLWENHLAEDEIGLPYEEVDSILHCMVDGGMGINEAASECRIDAKQVKKIFSMYENSAHKRGGMTRCAR